MSLLTPIDLTYEESEGIAEGVDFGFDHGQVINIPFFEATEICGQTHRSYVPHVFIRHDEKFFTWGMFNNFDQEDIDFSIKRAIEQYEFIKRKHPEFLGDYYPGIDTTQLDLEEKNDATSLHLRNHQ